MVWPAVIAGGALLGASLLGGKSNERIADRNRDSTEILTTQGRDWQDRNQYNALSSTFGESNVSGSFGNPSIYGGKGADLLGRDRDLDYSGRHIDQSFDKLGERGLTPQEIAGSPVPGGAKVSGGNNVLTNAVSNASSDVSRSRTAMNQARMQSQTQIATSQIQADAHIKGKAIEAGVNFSSQANQARISKYSVDTGRQNVLDRLKLQGRFNDAQISQIKERINAIKQDIRFKKILHSERWEKLFSTMSSENVLASVFAVESGVNIKEVLKGYAPSNKKALQRFIWHVSSSNSTTRSELLGASGLFSDLHGLFNSFSSSTNNKPLNTKTLMKNHQNSQYKKHPYINK